MFRLPAGSGQGMGRPEKGRTGNVVALTMRRGRVRQLTLRAEASPVLHEAGEPVLKPRSIQ
jgi:hypothetical protein